MKKGAFLLSLAFAGISSYCQTTYPLNGVHNKLHNYYAFTNASLFVDFKTFIPEATLLVKDGKVVASGSTVSIPKGSAVFDLNGKYIYPSFIDLCSDYGMPPIPKKKPANRKHTPPQYERNIEGAYSWNQAIHPETRAATLFSVDKKTADTLRRAGFGTVLTHSPDGIARGSASLVTLGDGKAVEEMLLSDAASCYSFRKGSSTQNYPSSLMGSMALLRQTFYDAVWYKDYAEKDERNISLEAINRYRNLPQVFEADNYLDVLMADTLGREFGIQFIVKGGGDEYKRIDLISKTGAPLILPLNFPKPFDVSDPYDALEIPLAALKHWELAPANPAFAERAGIRFALTTKGLGNKADFLKNLRKAVQSGLSPDTALKVLTYYPASFIGMQDEIGTLKPTALANFFIASGDLFDEKTIIYENWVQGRRHIIHNISTADIRGVYDLNIHSHIYKIRIAGSFEKPVAKWMQKDSLKNKINIRREGKLISLSFEIHDQFFNGYLRLSGKVNYKSGIWDGKAVLPDGTWVSWNAIRQKEKHDALGKGDSPAPDTMLFHRVWYPCTDFGFEEVPKAEDLLLKNARVWTNVDTLGILEHADILIQNGKISAVGKGFALPQGVKVIKLNGKNLTPGIIDEHSHIAIRGGVNEGSQAVSSEVRIGDVINPEDINIYRQLRGGVTVTHCLHGSANPIGGQTAVIKHRWGAGPEALKIKWADPFIKFALGENVKQSNWGDLQTIRFPQTRMGVEQVYYDALMRAREYGLQWKLYNSIKPKEQRKTKPPRRDLELDALSEVLTGSRFVTCHSYQQGEINMMMHVADSMGFKINTFTHILEGYKVADKMAAHGAGGSSFSDWWAYKYEVNDAIPYNMALMHDAKVLTAVNSDDAEMGRRLNQEAAKAVKYGGMSEEEALKLCTLNPARLLHLDSCMGSVAPGKDADLVIWTDNPLSVYAKVAMTFVDGICYFDRQKEKTMKNRMREERSRLILLMKRAAEKGEKTQAVPYERKREYRCDTLENLD